MNLKRQDDKTPAERYEEAIEKVAVLENQAAWLKWMRDDAFSALVGKIDADTNFEREHLVKSSGKYRKATRAWIEAEADANTARRHAEGLYIIWASWRTGEATEREKMKLL